MKQTRKIIIVICMTMLAVAIADNTRSILIPSFKEALSIDDAKIGIMLFLSSFSYLIGTLFMGKLLSFIPANRVMYTSLFIEITGILLMAYSPTTFVLFLATIILGLGTSGVALVINTSIPMLDVKKPALLMNFVHFTYGAGATITQKATGELLNTGLPFRNVYIFIALIQVFIMFLMTSIKLPDSKKNTDLNNIEGNAVIKSDKEGTFEPEMIKKPSFLKEFFTNFKAKNTTSEKLTKHQYKLLFFVALGLGLYAAAELQSGSWFYTYITETYKLNPSQASNFTATFFLVFTFGRLLGGLFVEKFGCLKSIIFSEISAFILYLVGLLMGEMGLPVIVCAGMFFSIVYPTTLLSLKEFFPGNFVKVTGIVVSTASFVNMISGPIVGQLSKSFGIRNAMFSLPIFLGASITLMILLYKNHNSGQQEIVE